jgi:hypothetical protein
MKTLIVMTVLALSVIGAQAQQVRYYDSRGNSLGTSSRTGNTTTFYNSRGSVIGRASR